MNAAIAEYWQSRPPRDRALIVLVAAITVLGLLYAYVWMPMNETRARLRAELPKLRGDAQQMQAQAKEIARLKAAPPAQGSAGPLEKLNQSAEAAGMGGAPPQVTQLAPDRVQVMIAATPFDRWIAWLGDLAAESGIRVESAQVNATGEPGVVRVQSVFLSPTN